MKKKILFVRPTLGDGGADRVTIQLLKYMDRDLYTAELALMRSEGAFIDDIPVDVPVHNLQVRKLWGMVLPLVSLIKKNKYDVIYSTSSGTNLVIALVKSLGAPGVYVFSERSTLHRNDGLKQHLLKRIKGVYYRKADWITAVSKEIGAQLISYTGVDQKKIIISENPLIDHHLLTRKNEQIVLREVDLSLPVVLAAGRLVPVKNFELLIRAFRLVCNHSNAHLFILGSGPLKEQLSILSLQLGIADRVHLLGFDKNPFKYMAKCDVFVLSSNFEGMPGVLIQAMACGAAVVSTDCPTGPAEVIDNGHNGFLVPVNDEQAMADKILLLLNDPQLNASFRERAPLAVVRFEVRQAIQTYFNFLS